MLKEKWQTCFTKKLLHVELLFKIYIYIREILKQILNLNIWIFL